MPGWWRTREPTRHVAPNLRATPAYHDPGHYVLSDPQAGPMGPNVEADGRNLTIAFLSLNRVDLSIRLLRSIPEHLTSFAGEVLIGDNGSDPDQLARLRAYLREEFPYRWRLLEFGENLGVAGGRNRLMMRAATDWVMSLDNDVYFVADPLPSIQEELATLGCHFMSFPLLDADRQTCLARGACLQTVWQDGQARLTINPVFTPNTPAEDAAPGAFLCSFLFGGAAVLNRHSFLRLGGFDENMLVGFEDIDFSLRLFQAGMKVATSGAHFLVHDHGRADSAPDDAYERARFSQATLRRSAHYLERKTGFRIWGAEVESWLRDNARRQGWREEIGPDDDAPAPPRPAVRKPRIALLTDTGDWAFANIARQLRRHLSDRYDFEIYPLVELAEIERKDWYDDGCRRFFPEGGGAGLGPALVAAEDCDVVHVFWREFLMLIDAAPLRDYAGRLGLDYAEFRRRFVANKAISTAVYDHLFLDEKSLREWRGLFTELIDAYYVSSPRLAAIYRDIADYPDPAAVLPDGVDLSLFRPRRLARFRNIAHRPLRIGWVGNSRWAATLGDTKGVETILKPAIEELRREGMDIRTYFADRHIGHIPHHEMPDYYAAIDVLICASEAEGTPNPVLEAMACGVPVITTDVGIVREALGEKQRRFILKRRDKESLKQAIRTLRERPELFAELSAENLQSVKCWDWAERARAFIPYFDRLVRLGQLRNGERQSRMCLLPFTTASVETDGAIRLCSAASTFAYREETNMGNCREGGLMDVWRGEKFKNVRRGLLSGHELKPYCARCEYRHAGPAWMLQLHLALHAWHEGVRDEEVLALIGRYLDRHADYADQAASYGLSPLPLPDDLRRAARAAADSAMAGRKRDEQTLLRQLAPAALLDAGRLPLSVDFNTLNRCNVTCVMCPPALKIARDARAREPYYRLSVEEFDAITAGVNLRTAHFVGAYAEPLLNKELFALIARARARGAFTAVTTNGTVLARFAGQLIDSGLDMLTLSIHGATARTAEAIMRGADFGRVIDGVRTLQRLKKERGLTRPQIHANYVVQKANMHELADFVELAADLGLDHVNFVHLIDGDAAVDKRGNSLDQPERLARHLAAASAAAERLGLSVAFSPAFDEVWAAENPATG